MKEGRKEERRRKEGRVEGGKEGEKERGRGRGLTLSASIRAPASITNSWLSSSFTTAAVRPAALLAFPDV